MSEEKAALKPFLAKAVEGQVLSFEEAHAAFEIIMSGGATPAQIAGFLVALRMRGETVDELSGAVSVIRAKAKPVSAPAGAMDIVGTGGDGKHTLNISTATAIVTAACGVPIAKHGNRALSSKSGATDVLTQLGVNIDCEVPVIEQSIREAGIGYMAAPNHHASFRFVGPVRVEMGIRTLFNIMGPLCNPASVKRYLIGVYAPEWVRPMAEVLGRLGCEKAWVVHGADGLDELSVTGSNQVCEVSAAGIREFTLSPDDAGLAQSSLTQLQGGDAQYNASCLQNLLAGEKGAYRDVVLFGTAAALVIADKVESLEAGVHFAERAIDEGRAARTLEQFIAVTGSGK